MNLKEMQKLMTIISLAYPYQYKNMSLEEKAATMQLYYNCFCKYPAGVMDKALKNYLLSNKYPPTIAGLMEQVKLLQIDDSSREELWKKIAKAVRNGLYNAEEEFVKLPEECRKWIREPAAIRDFARLDPGIFNTVTRGQFMKEIAVILEKAEAAKTVSKEKNLVESPKGEQLDACDIGLLEGAV